MIRYFLIFSGRVQGVGFRFFAQTNALKYSLTGIARNMNNGMVEVQVQGTEENINNFIYTVKKGNMFIRVDDVSIKKVNINPDEKKFKIVY
ncbi:MAG: acylphosphatase [Clostridiaceae bacterium]|nr:acylphosphatase [Clostridiaceae bacterium]